MRSPDRAGQRQGIAIRAAHVGPCTWSHDQRAARLRRLGQIVLDAREQASLSFSASAFAVTPGGVTVRASLPHVSAPSTPAEVGDRARLGRGLGTRTACVSPPGPFGGQRVRHVGPGIEGQPERGDDGRSPGTSPALRDCSSTRPAPPWCATVWRRCSSAAPRLGRVAG